MNGSTVDNDGHLVVKPSSKPQLDELLAQCDASSEISEEDRAWMETEPVGRELNYGKDF